MREGHVSEAQSVKARTSQSHRERWRTDYTGPDQFEPFVGNKPEFENFKTIVVLTMLFSYQILKCDNKCQ